MRAQHTSQRRVDDPDGDIHEGPAALANGCAAATGPDLVVICHIDIKDQLLLHWLELTRFDLFMVFRLRCAGAAAEGFSGRQRSTESE